MRKGVYTLQHVWVGLLNYHSRRDSDNAPERASTRSKGLCGSWGGEATQRGKAPNVPSCQCNLDSPPANEMETSLACPLLAGQPASRVADDPLAHCDPPRGLVQSANWTSNHPCDPVKFTLTPPIHHCDWVRPTSGQLSRLANAASNCFPISSSLV